MTDSPAKPIAPLTAPHVLEFTYTRSVGPIIGRFLGELRERRIVGVRTASGRVLVPPQEYDPETGDPVKDFVEVGPGGVVETWAWVGEPREKHPLRLPFAFALIRLDGAHTAMLHVVDAGDETRMASGMRVCPRWRDETLGEIHDIVCFDPEDA